MSAWIESINEFGAAWATWVWRAAWQGAMVIAIAWLLAVALRRWSPQVRSWIWRLVFLKLLLLLVWTTPIALAVLPAGEGSEVGVQGSAQESRVRGLQSEDKASMTGRMSEAAVQNSTVAVQDSRDDPANLRLSAQTVTPSIKGEPPSPVRPFTPSLSPSSWLFLAWSAGLIAMLGWLAIEIAKAIRLYRSVRLIDEPSLVGLAAEVSRELGLRLAVQLGESDLAAGPMLLKFLRPCVVFPSGLLPPFGPNPRLRFGVGIDAVSPKPQAALSDDEIRLILAHELAHIKRHDLAWNALAAVVQCVLYFHPLVWLAHRWSRQEQEMACDEIVVTRLNVQRHAYGELLVKLVRQMSRSFQPTVAAVAMSRSYQNLSKRITAMERINSLTRRQWTIALVFFAIVGVLAIVPWRVVAQEKKSPEAAKSNKSSIPLGDALAEKPTTENESPSKPMDDKADPEFAKLLVGSWRDQAGKRVIFFKDGNYDDLGLDIFFRRSSAEADQGRRVARSYREHGQGSWQVQAGHLNLTNEASVSYWTARPASVDPLTDKRPSPCNFEILRLDDSFLRLKFDGVSPNTLFLRRVEEKSIDERFAAVPAELRPFFDAAQFSPEEADALLQLFEGSNISVGNLAVMARIQQAQRRAVTLQELFAMSHDEVTAFQELLKQHFGSGDSLDELSDGGQLTATEDSGYKKIRAVTDTFDVLATSLPMPRQASLSGEANNFLQDRVRRNSTRPTLTPIRPQQRRRIDMSEIQMTAFAKLCVHLDELERWYRAAVFQGNR